MTSEEPKKSISKQKIEKINLIEPATGKLFFDRKTELLLCKPHLMPLKSQALERLENMHRETRANLQNNRAKTADATKKQDS